MQYKKEGLQMLNYFLKTPVYLIDNGHGGAIWLFLMAGFGFLLTKLGGYMFECSNSCFLGILGQFLQKLGIALIFTGVISGIISLF